MTPFCVQAAPVVGALAVVYRVLKVPLMVEAFNVPTLIVPAVNANGVKL